MEDSVLAKGLVTLPATATAEEILEIYNRDGGVIVKEVLSPEHRARINAELDPYIAKINPETDYGDSGGAFGRLTKRMEGLVEKSDAVVEALLDPRFQEVVARTLTWGGEYQLNAAQLIEIGPGEPAQILHRDEGLWPQVAGGPHELMISCMLALTDFTEEVGATRVAPGTNRNQHIQTDSLDVEKDTVPALMKAGDAMFFSGKVIHGGGANRTDQPRRGLSMTYSLGWLKPEEAQTLAVSRERARQLPPRMRELCSLSGYRPYGSAAPDYFFHRLEMNDPYEIIFGEKRP